MADILLLPDEIQWEILSKVTLVDLLMLRRVSKQWSSLIRRALDDILGTTELVLEYNREYGYEMDAFWNWYEKRKCPGGSLYPKQYICRNFETRFIAADNIFCDRAFSPTSLRLSKTRVLKSLYTDLDLTYLYDTLQELQIFHCGSWQFPGIRTTRTSKVHSLRLSYAKIRSSTLNQILSSPKLHLLEMYECSVAVDEHLATPTSSNLCLRLFNERVSFNALSHETKLKQYIDPEYPKSMRRLRSLVSEFKSSCRSFEGWTGSDQDLLMYQEYYPDSLLSLFLQSYFGSSKYKQVTESEENYIQESVRVMLQKPRIYMTVDYRPSLELALLRAPFSVFKDILEYHQPLIRTWRAPTKYRSTPERFNRPVPLLALTFQHQWEECYKRQRILYEYGVEPLASGFIHYLLQKKPRARDKSGGREFFEQNPGGTRKFFQKTTNSLYLAIENVSKEECQRVLKNEQCFSSEKKKRANGQLELAALYGCTTCFRWIEWGYPVYPSLLARLIKGEKDYVISRLLPWLKHPLILDVGKRTNHNGFALNTILDLAVMHNKVEVFRWIMDQYVAQGKAAQIREKLNYGPQPKLSTLQLMVRYRNECLQYVVDELKCIDGYEAICDDIRLCRSQYKR